MNRLNIILVLCTIAFGLVAGNQITQRQKKDAEIVVLTDEKEISDSLHLYKDKRLTNYFNVTLIQDSIIEVNSFTRNLKENHKPLLNYSSKL